jgi:hypothetical protein
MPNEQATYSLAPSTVISANGNSGDLFVGDATELDFDVNITALDAAATFTLFVERKGEDGVYYPIYSPTAVVAAPAVISQAIGPGLEDARDFGHLVRIRWTITALKTVTLSMSLMRK